MEGPPFYRMAAVRGTPNHIVAVASIRRDVTRVTHCAAIVAFDDPYETSFRAKVGGTLNALAFSRRLQNSQKGPGSIIFY
jgi:hypothetical protein